MSDAVRVVEDRHPHPLCIDPATGSKGGVIGGFELTKHIGTEEGDNEPLVCPYCPIKPNVYINVRLGRPKIYGS